MQGRHPSLSTSILHVCCLPSETHTSAQAADGIALTSSSSSCCYSWGTHVVRFTSANDRCSAYNIALNWPTSTGCCSSNWFPVSSHLRQCRLGQTATLLSSSQEIDRASPSSMRVGCRALPRLAGVLGYHCFEAGRWWAGTAALSSAPNQGPSLKDQLRNLYKKVCSATEEDRSMQCMWHALSMHLGFTFTKSLHALQVHPDLFQDPDARATNERSFKLLQEYLAAGLLHPVLWTCSLHPHLSAALSATAAKTRCFSGVLLS